MGLTIEKIKAINQEATKKEAAGKEAAKKETANPEDVWHNTSGDPFRMKPNEPGLLDGMFPIQTNDLVKGLVYSFILSEPRCRAHGGQRGGSPWRSRF